MANSERKINELPTRTNISNNALLVAVHDPVGVPTTVNITYANFFANVNVSTVKFNGVVTLANTSANNLVANNFSLTNSWTPTSSSQSGTVRGNFWWDNNFLYLAVANNTIKRVGLSTF